MSEFYQGLINGISEHYWVPLSKYIADNPSLLSSFPAFLIKNEMIVIYIGIDHIAIEYFGEEQIEELPDEIETKIKILDYSDTNNLLEDIIGFKYNSKMNINFPLPDFSLDWVLPTNEGFDLMIQNKWNWIAQDSILTINSPMLKPIAKKFHRIINSRFYDADDNGLKTRHIKWLDFIPIEKKEQRNGEEFKINIGPLKSLVENDARYIYPMPNKDDYKYFKLPIINRFIELIGNKETSETDITSFLEKDDHKFILTMGFFAKNIYSQILCEWQSENRNDIKPDFLIEKPNDYSDIVEFKLPNLKSKSIVGIENRESFSAEISSYISQTRVYKEYFEDPNNRTWLENNHKIKVRYPKRFLVMGRRWDFKNEEWKDICEEFNQLEILTYDDLIEGVVSQFYV